jgi:hypothetical protein
LELKQGGLSNPIAELVQFPPQLRFVPLPDVRVVGLVQFDDSRMQLQFRSIPVGDIPGNLDRTHDAALRIAQRGGRQEDVQ